MFLVQFFFGFFLGYYCMSPRLRGFINRCVVGLFRLCIHEKRRVRSNLEWVDVTYERLTNTPEIKEAEPLRVEPFRVGDKHRVVVGKEKLAEWLENNPELRKRNGVK